jgi:hypothetical protein
LDRHRSAAGSRRQAGSMPRATAWTQRSRSGTLTGSTPDLDAIFALSLIPVVDARI